MEIGIIGFDKSGKTTVFNALTGASAKTAKFSESKLEPNVGVVNVPDERLYKLHKLFNPPKCVPAAVKYTDLPGTSKEDLKKREGLDVSQIQYVGTVEAILVVVRAFDDGTGIEVNPEGDIESINLELFLTDLIRVENRLPRIEKSIAKITGKERETLENEFAILTKIKAVLDENKPIRTLSFTEDEERIIKGFKFLTAKPILYILNIDENILLSGRDLASEVKQNLSITGEWEAVDQMCGEIEMEIAQLGEDEREVFMKDYGIQEPASKRIIHKTSELLGLISFFTLGEKETHSWTAKKGTPANKAAGIVHTDFERGFIRAEVINWKDLLDLGGLFCGEKIRKITPRGKRIYCARW